MRSRIILRVMVVESNPMPRSATDISRLTGLASRFAGFVAERYPMALTIALEAMEAARQSVAPGADPHIHRRLPRAFRRELARRLYEVLTAPQGIDETTPGTPAIKRLEQARVEIVDALRRVSARARRFAHRSPRTSAAKSCAGWCLTRALDNRLKQLFMGGEVRWGETRVSGQGFPVARARGDLCRRHQAPPRRGASGAQTDRGPATCSRR